MRKGFSRDRKLNDRRRCRKTTSAFIGPKPHFVKSGCCVKTWAEIREGFPLTGVDVNTAHHIKHELVRGSMKQFDRLILPRWDTGKRHRKQPFTIVVANSV